MCAASALADRTEGTGSLILSFCADGLKLRDFALDHFCGSWRVGGPLSQPSDSRNRSASISVFRRPGSLLKNPWDWSA